MRDRGGVVVYVGKAVNLRSRVRGYFAKGRGDDRAFVPLLDRLLGDIEILRVGNEQEALLLENELIKRYQPRFNVLLRDDKDFLTLRLDTRHACPKIEVWRRPDSDGARYFGPYASASAVRQTLGIVNRHFQLRTCSDSEMRRRSRPCLQHQIGRCPAPCVRPVPEYQSNVRDAVLFLEGRHTVLVKDLESRMRAASKELAFEEAARLRDLLLAVQQVLERQRIVRVSDSIERDAVGLYREGPTLSVQILEMQGGRITGGNSHVFEDQEFPTEELLGSLLTQVYAKERSIPAELLLPIEVESRQALQDWLSERRGRNTVVRVPRRGEKRRMVELATQNAAASFRMRSEQAANDHGLLERLARSLGLARFPHRIECYDISQTQGGAPVASRVAMLEGRPDKSRYRRYRIKSVSGQDDYGMMREALMRRLARGRREEDLPDLLVVDGGKGQLGVARAVLEDLGLEDLDVIALAKGRAKGRSHQQDDPLTEATAPSPDRVFVVGRKDPVVLAPDSAELLLLARLRDEAHRFAITFHRKARSKQAMSNRLERIEGVGPARRKALLRAFGSVKRAREATEEEIAAVPGFSLLLARRVKEGLVGKK